MKSHISVWREFCDHLNSLQTDSLSKQDLFSCTCEWLAKNSGCFGEDIWRIYGLDIMLKVSPSDYPVKYSEDTVDQTVSGWKALKPSSIDSIAMTVRDILWDMLAYKSKVECPNCGDDDLRVLFDKQGKVNVLCCDLCCWSQFESGEKWSGKQNLVPANISQLMVSGYLRNTGIESKQTSVARMELAESGVGCPGFKRASVAG